MEVLREKNGNTCRRKHRGERRGEKRGRAAKWSAIRQALKDERDRDVLRKPGQKPIVRHAAGIVPATCHLPTPF